MNINFKELATLQSTIITNKESFDSLLTKIEQINARLATAWQGDDSSKYGEKVLEQVNLMKQLSSTIGEIAQFLSEVNTAYQKAVEANTLQ